MDKKRFPQNRGAPSVVADQSARFLDTIDTPALHRENLDGSTSKKVLGKLYTTPSKKPAILAEVSKLAWVPEGIVFTPRTAAAPNGWGLPPTPDGLGTVGGDFPYVILNKYKHNNTPEYLHKVYSDSPVLGVETLRMSLNWPALYIDDEDTVAWQSNRKLQQFMCRWLPILKEKKQVTWFAHRPKVRDYSFEVQQSTFIAVNLIRTGLGKAAFSKPLEGWTTDSAQATCLENVKAKTFAHDSILYRYGWQTTNERALDRVGRYQDSGENLYASGLGTSKTDLALEAVAWWQASPLHYATMIRDYTTGKRAQYTLNGTAQLIGEVMTVGTWNVANLGLSFRGREVTTIQESINPRGASCTTWRHPVFGSIGTINSPSLGGYIGTRNMSWGEKQVSSYKQTDILAVVNVIADFNTRRENLLGAGMVIKMTGDAMQSDQWAKIVKEKNRREERYSKLLAKQSLPPDTACVESEVGIDLVQASWRLEMRTMSYEEFGTPYQTPNPATVCKFILRGGKMEDFIKTRAVIKEFTIPFNPCGFYSSALFSQDGTKAIVAAAELLDDGNGASSKWQGEKLHFYEFDGDTASEVATSQIDILVTDIAGLYKQTANGQVKLYPYYEENTLKWVEMKVAHEGSRNSLANTSKRVLYASLIFPDTFEWVYCNTASGGAIGSSDAAVDGVVKHILYLDPINTERTHWIEFTIVSTAPSTTTVSAAIMRDIKTPTLVKTLYSGLTVDAQSNGQPWLVPMYADKSSLTTGLWTQYLHPAWRWAGSGLPPTDFKGSFGLGSGSLDKPSGGQYTFGGTGSPRSTPLAPVVFGKSSRFDDNLADGTLDTDYVLGGAFFGQPFGFGKTGAPTDTWVYFKSSSLDLEAITGISGMDDNILPLWSL